MADTFSLRGQEVFLERGTDVLSPTPFSLMLAEGLSVPSESICLDLGCGSGIQAVVMALLGAKRVYAVDVSENCVATTIANAALNHVADRVMVLQGNMFQPVSGLTFDVIVSNPPTFPAAPGTPAGAISEDEGRSFLDSLIGQSFSFLRAGGALQFVQSSLADIDDTLLRLHQTGFRTRVDDARVMPFRPFYYGHAEFFATRARDGGRARFDRDGDMLSETVFLLTALKPTSEADQSQRLMGAVS